MNMSIHRIESLKVTDKHKETNSVTIESLNSDGESIKITLFFKDGVKPKLEGRF